MKKFRTYIAFVLLPVLIFPVVFQSVHTIKHHWYEINKCCNSHDTPEQDYTVTIFTSCDNEFECPVCEYEFHVNNLHAVPEITISCVSVNYKYSGLIPGQTHLIIITYKF